MSIQIKGLNKSYHLGAQPIQILKDLNVKIKTSEVVAVLGSSGSGKSTLLSLLAGLDSSDSGEILFNEVDIAQLNQKELTAFRAENIGIVFQNYYLVSHLTALENVLLPLEIQNKKIEIDEAESLLQKVGLGHRLHHAPGELSGGESQRLAIARALITKPQLLLADEPSGSLDTETGKKVMDLFFDQIREIKTTTILVTHDRALADRCDRVLKLENGQLCEI
ncbi:MAG: ABC transporter ATP-binding protein [Bdellovibrionaceae bacterium]|nr:ABC transporter ATP-binding protein [Pseudobdellovibrionaceae bacterium]